VPIRVADAAWSTAHRQPGKTSPELEARVCDLRTELERGPRRPACSACLARPVYRPAHPLLRTRPARRTGPRRRQEDRPATRRRRRARPGQLWTPARPLYVNKLGYEYIHAAIDDRTRLA